MNRRSARKMTFTSLESLEDRLVLAASPATNPYEALVVNRGGPLLGAIYTELVNYYQEGAHGQFLAAQSNTVEMSGTSVGIDVRFGAGNFYANATQMQQLGMVITAGVPSIGLVEGYMPIYQLPTVAGDANVSSLSPVLKPTLKIPTPSISPAVPAGPVTPTPITNPMAAGVAVKGGPVLGSIFQDLVNYEVAGAHGTFVSAEAAQVEFIGGAVGIDVRTTPANFYAMAAQLQADGMYITAGVPQLGIIEGFLPVMSLPEVAVNGGLVGMSPIYKPTLR